MLWSETLDVAMTVTIYTYLYYRYYIKMYVQIAKWPVIFAYDSKSTRKEKFIFQSMNRFP